MGRYIAKKPDAKGFINFDEEENAIWSILFERQLKVVENRAYDEFIVWIKTVKFF